MNPIFSLSSERKTDMKMDRRFLFGVLTTISVLAALGFYGRSDSLQAQKPAITIDLTPRRPPPPKTGLLNIEDFGCKPISTHPDFDNAPILQKMFDRLGRDLHGTIYIPGNGYVIKSSLILPTRSGVSILGTGITGWWAEPQYLKRTGVHNVGGPASRLIWKGEANQPMLIYSGYGLRIDGLTLQGRYSHTLRTETQGEMASVGLLIQKTKIGFNPGKVYVSHMQFIFCGTGIFCSKSPKENHADNFVGNSIYFQECNIGFRSNNRQSVGHDFQHVHWTFERRRVVSIR